jgi:hypothetical protein
MSTEEEQQHEGRSAEPTGIIHDTGGGDGGGDNAPTEGESKPADTSERKGIIHDTGGGDGEGDEGGDGDGQE